MSTPSITPLSSRVLRAIEARPGMSATEIANAIDMHGCAIVIGKTAMGMVWAGLVSRKPGRRGFGAAEYTITPFGSRAIKDAAMAALKRFASKPTHHTTRSE